MGEWGAALLSGSLGPATRPAEGPREGPRRRHPLQRLAQRADWLQQQPPSAHVNVCFCLESGRHVGRHAGLQALLHFGGVCAQRVVSLATIHLQWVGAVWLW